MTIHMRSSPYPHMKNAMFAECFCAKNNIPPEKYVRAVFNRVLYKRTHPFRWLLRVVDPHYFAADYDLILGVAQACRMSDFVLEAERFNNHPANHGWLRRTFCLRVSTNRLKALMRETLPQKARHVRSRRTVREHTSAAPFEMAGSGGVPGFTKQVSNTRLA
jgi:hypothetical protein